MELARQAIQMDGRSRAELTQAMKDLTELENPNSVQQMKTWLSLNGMETDTLDKKAVAEMLKTASPELRRALTLRQQLAKSSVKKYQAMETAVCADGRARGMFQFYGANRTGRWAGRIIQMQNLPQNHLEDLAEARGLVRCGDFEGVEMLYEDVPDNEIVYLSYDHDGMCYFNGQLFYKTPAQWWGNDLYSVDVLSGKYLHYKWFSEKGYAKIDVVVGQAMQVSLCIGEERYSFNAREAGETVVVDPNLVPNEMRVIENKGEITFVNAYTTKKLLPPKASGWYTYYEASEGYTYVVCEFVVKNLGMDITTDDGITGYATVDGQKVDGFCVMASRDQSDFGNYRFEVLAEHVAFFIIELPDDKLGAEIAVDILFADERFVVPYSGA